MTVSSGRFDALTRARQSTRTRTALAALFLALLSGCGKKGPPLAPFSSVPATPAEITVRRKGDQVEIRFKVPVANSDGRRPARIDYVDVVGLTMPGGDARSKGSSREHASGSPERGGAGPREEMPFKKYGTVVASVLVRKPPPKPKEPKEGEPPPPPPPPRTDPGLDQGDLAIVIDTLTPASLTPVEIPEKGHAHEHAAKETNVHESPLTPPDLGPPLPTPPLRYYTVQGRNGRKKGPPSQPIPVPVAEIPPAPADLKVVVAEGKINVTVVAPEGLHQPVLPYFPSPIEGAAPPAGLPPVVPGAVPATPTAPPAVPALPAAPAPSAPTPPPAVPPPTGTDDLQQAVPCVPASAASAATAGKPDTAAPAATASAAPAGQSAAPGAPTTPGAPLAPAAPLAPVAPPCIPAPTTLLAAKLLSPFPSPIYGYMVYEVAPPDFKPPPQQPGALPPFPRLLTTAPVTAGLWSDTRFEVGVERCYVARTVSTLGQIVSESAPTPPVCVKTVDTFPPAAPKNLQAVASEGAISLIWDSNSEPDLAGYIVLRGVAGSDKLTAVTPTPIKESTYRDIAVKAGVRYVYAVVAVDNAATQNVSAQSNHVEETAR